ncbi:MAG TPA: hypothetical protein VHA78_04365 [Candidatus Peribacteraceae bacterium]|nr:hypothetical protein [Candidatus Peribacteraceae bacterium]
MEANRTIGWGMFVTGLILFVIFFLAVAFFACFSDGTTPPLCVALSPFGFPFVSDGMLFAKVPNRLPDLAQSILPAPFFILLQPLLIVCIITVILRIWFNLRPSVWWFSLGFIILTFVLFCAANV